MQGAMTHLLHNLLNYLTIIFFENEFIIMIFKTFQHYYALNHYNKMKLSPVLI